MVRQQVTTNPRPLRANAMHTRMAPTPKPTDSIRAALPRANTFPGANPVQPRSCIDEQCGAIATMLVPRADVLVAHPGSQRAASTAATLRQTIAGACSVHAQLLPQLVAGAELHARVVRPVQFRQHLRLTRPSGQVQPQHEGDRLGGPPGPSAGGSVSPRSRRSRPGCRSPVAAG